MTGNINARGHAGAIGKHPGHLGWSLDYYGFMPLQPLSPLTLKPIMQLLRPAARTPMPAARLTLHRLGLAVFVAAACTTAQAEPQGTTNVQHPATVAKADGKNAGKPLPQKSAMTARLLYEVLLSEMSFNRGNAEQATALMLSAARRTNDEGLFKRATEMAIRAHNGHAALEAASAWRNAHPESAKASQYELQVLIVLGRIGATEEPIKHFLSTLPEADQVAFITALPMLYQRAPSKSQAVQIVEQALSATLTDPRLAPAAWSTIGRMRLQAGDKGGALTAATMGQTSDPTSEWPPLLALQLLAEGVGDAEPIIQRYVAQGKARPDFRINYARALVDQHRIADAHAELTRLINDNPDDPDAWLVQGALHADEGDASAAEAALTRYMTLAQAQEKARKRVQKQSPQGTPNNTPEDAPADTPDDASEESHTSELVRDITPGLDQARMMLARIAEQRKHWDEAEHLLNQIQSPDQALAVQVRKAVLQARQGRLDQALEILHNASEQTPDDARVKQSAEVQILQRFGRPQAAYELLQAELAKTPEDDTLIYETALAAERVNRLDEAEHLLRQLIARNPNGTAPLNALGFTLADRNERLPEARMLLEKAAALASDDAYIQDSLGWLEFREGQLQKARQTLKTAFQLQPNPEIAAHLGEVLWTLNERDAARAIWRKGAQLDAEDETLLKTMRRFQFQP